MSFDAGQILEDVERGSARLEEAADRLHDAVKRFELAERAYELAMAKLRVTVDIESHDEIGKLPSQDRRQDLALTLIAAEQPDVYTEYFAAKADKEAQAVLYRALAASVSARQSLLKALQ